jgi:hypothetical protein
MKVFTSISGSPYGKGMLAAAVFAVLASVTGCGGGGGGSSSPGGGGGGTTSSYQGNYNGTFSADTTAHGGDVHFSINASGAMTAGTIDFNGQSGIGHDLVGGITNAGVMTGNYAVGGHSYTASGQLQPDPLTAHRYSVILHVHDDTANTDQPNAAATLDRS